MEADQRRGIYWKYLTLILFFITLFPGFNGEEVGEAFPLSLEEDLKWGLLCERQGRYEEARSYYEGLKEKHQNDPNLFEPLRKVYLKLGLFKELENLAKSYLSQQPTQAKFRAALGEAYLKQGKTKEAKREWESLLSDSPLEDSYQLVASLYEVNGMAEEAVGVYLQGRKRFKDETVFSLELANLYENDLDYEKAINEYLRYLQRYPKQVTWTEQQIRRICKSEGLELGIKALKAAITRAPKRGDLHKICGDLYLQNKDYESALKEYEKIEEFKGETFLLEFGKTCEEESLFEVALRAYEMLGKTASKNLSLALRIGYCQKKMGLYKEALETYKKIFTRYPEAKEAQEARYQTGEVYFEQNKLEEAIFHYENLVKLYPQSSYYFEAGQRIAECYWLRGEIAKAKEKLKKLGKEKISPAIQERILFKLAEITFMDGDFREALELYQNLIREFPEGLYLNDSLERIVFLEENLPYGEEPLKKYVQTLFLIEAHKLEEALLKLRMNITNFPSHPIVDDCWLQIGFLLTKEGKFYQGIEAYRNLIKENPESELCPEAQRRIGEIYAEELKDPKKASEEFELIILQYPHSLLVEGVRRRIGELKGLVQK